MHPIERLRHVARAGSVEHGVLAQEAAAALGNLGDDPGGLVLACKRLVDRHPAAGPLWTMCARVLLAGDPRKEAWRCLAEVDDDLTASHVVQLLPDDAVVTVLGWPEIAARALPPRGDLVVRVVDVLGEGRQLVRRLALRDVEVSEVPESGAAAAVLSGDLVLLEALASGPDAFLSVPGARAAAAVARHAGVPVWVVVGAGRALPGPLWDGLTARVAERGDPWDADVEVVPLDLIDVVVGPVGQATGTELAVRADAPVAPELLRTDRPGIAR
ncbi:MAG: hypothetical protein WD232_04815 [Acidimicrobiales bacterium]